MGLDLSTAIKDGRVMDVYILARHAYRVGSPLISDANYETLESYLKANKLEEVKPYLGRSYDDDPIPFNLLRAYGLENLIVDMGVNNKYYKYLDEEKSLSIRAVTTTEEAYEFFMNNRDKDLIISLKVDGVNGKSLFINGHLQLSISRGRKGMGFDFTKGISRAIPTIISHDNKEIKVFTENYVQNNALLYLRQKYDQTKFKTEKSSALSMLRVQVDLEDYKYLHSLAFNAEGISDKISTTLKVLEENGFKTVPYLIVPKDTVPQEYSVFTTWLNQIMEQFGQTRSVIPSDGIVVDIDDLKHSSHISNQYADRNIALKFGPWSFTSYTATVTDIVIEQKRVYASCRIRIEPMVTNDSSTARWVTGYNLSILKENGIKIGSPVTFERNSGAINILVRTNKLSSFK